LVDGQPTSFLLPTNISPALKVRLERIRRQWRQVDLAEKAGVTQAKRFLLLSEGFTSYLQRVVEFWLL